MWQSALLLTVILQTVAVCITAQCSFAEIGSLHYFNYSAAESGRLHYCPLSFFGQWHSDLLPTLVLLTVAVGIIAKCSVAESGSLH
jgi:hypothetical protein